MLRPDPFCGAVVGVLLAVAAVAGAEEPAMVYMLNCQGCHRADGAGTEGTVPPLRGHVAKFLHTDAGREFLIRVPGVAQAALDEREIAELMNWLVRRFDPEHMPAAFRPYTADEVASLRKRPLVDPDAARRAILSVESLDAGMTATGGIRR